MISPINFYTQKFYNNAISKNFMAHKTAKPIVENGTNKFVKTPQKENFLTRARDIFGEIFPHLDPDFRRIYKKTH